jgi:hypothetical protein
MGYLFYNMYLADCHITIPKGKVYPNQITHHLIYITILHLMPTEYSTNCRVVLALH